MATRPISISGSRFALFFPFEGREIRILADPSELLPLLAESGQCGLSLVGGPEPGLMLAGAACPNCGEDDLNWLSVEDDSETAHCDRCGGDFGLGSRFDSQPRSRHSAEGAC
jgi:Zn ribbon nucleic-acid-binding protein